MPQCPYCGVYTAPDLEEVVEFYRDKTVAVSLYEELVGALLKSEEGKQAVQNLLRKRDGPEKEVESK